MVAQFTTFIGRTHELAEIAALLADPACRLLTLVGPGGIGKTRLAREVFNPSLNPSATGTSFGRPFHGEGLKDGIHFVPLQSVSDATLLPIAIANAIGIQFFGSDEPRVQLVNYLQERQTLLILDNFEHLLEGVDFVVELLSASGVKLLVTSRVALNVRAEWRYAVGGLEIPDREALGGSETRPYHDTIENFDAIKLFTERARRLRHDFSLDEQQAHVIRICQLTEGMPLALELAAGWIKALSCAEIANEIQRGLDFLAADTRDVPERHRSMAAAFSQSWHMLSDDEQAVFRKMSVFRGGFTREAAENVTGANLQILASLVDKSFLRIDTAGRYDIHELMRQYGEAKLAEAGEGEAIRDLHSAYYLEFLAEREADIKGRRQIGAINEIDTDFENVRVAWHHGADQKNEDAIYDATYCLMWFCQVRRPLYRKELGQYALERFAPRPSEQPGLVWAYILYAMHSMSISEIIPERPSYDNQMIEQSLVVAAALHHPLLTAYCRLELGANLVRVENPDALLLLEAAIAVFRAGDDMYYLAAALGWLALHYRPFNLDLTIQLFQECVHTSLQIGAHNLGGWALYGLSVTMYRTGKFDRVGATLEKALSLFSEIGDHAGLLEVRHYLSFMAFFQGRFDEARRLNAEAHQAALDSNFRDGTLGTFHAAMFISCVADEDYARTQHLYNDNVLRWSGRMLSHNHFIATILASVSADYDGAKQHFCKIFRSFYGHTFITLRLVFLPTAVLILAGVGESERAAEILGLVFNHPASPKGWIEKWGLLNRLSTEICDKLGETAYKAAWERGAKTNLDTVINQLLREWQDSPQAGQPLVDPLTERELEVLRLVVAGLSNSQIAAQLVVTIGTVKAHIHNIYGKLNVENRTQAVIRARELHLL